jgi:hypothetical protein
MRRIVLATLTAMSLALPMAAHAQVVQDTVNGTQNGVQQGNEAAGPIGGIVGGAVGAGVGAATGAVGAATGIVGSIFGAPDDRARFHDYAEQQHRRSYAMEGDLQVGTVLPRHGVTLYPVPRDYRVDRHYRYAVVNDQTVIVDPRTRRVVEVLD